MMILREVPSLLRSLLCMLLWSASTICICASVSATIYLNPHLCSTWQWIELEDFSISFLFHDNNHNRNFYESILRNSIDSGLLENLIEAAVSNDGNVTLALSKNFQEANTITNYSTVEFISVNFETLNILNGTELNDEHNVTVMLHAGVFNLVYPCSNNENDAVQDTKTTDDTTSGNTTRTLVQRSLSSLPITITTMVMQSVQNQSYYLIDQLNLTSYSVTIVIPQLKQHLQEENSKGETQTTSSPSPAYDGEQYSSTAISTRAPTNNHRITSRPWRKTTSTPTKLDGPTLSPRNTETESSYPMASVNGNFTETSEGLSNGTLFLKRTVSPSTSPVLPKLSPSETAYNSTAATENLNYTASFSTTRSFPSSERNPKKPTVEIRGPNYSANSNTSKNSTTFTSNVASMIIGPTPSRYHVPMLSGRPRTVMVPQKQAPWSVETPKANSTTERDSTNNASITEMTSPSPHKNRTYSPTVPVLYMNKTVTSPIGTNGFINYNVSRNESSRSSENAVALSKSNTFPPIFFTGIICFIILGALGIAFFVKKSKAPNVKTSVGPKSPVKNGSKFRRLMMKKGKMNSISSDVKNHHPFSPQFMMPPTNDSPMESADESNSAKLSTWPYKASNATTAINSNLSDGHRMRKSSPRPERNFQELHSDDDESELDLLSLHSANTTVSTFFQLDPDWDPNDVSNDEDTERKGNFFVVSSHSKSNRDRGDASADRMMRRYPLTEGNSSQSLEFSRRSDEVITPSASMSPASSSPAPNKLERIIRTPPGNKTKSILSEESSSAKRLARNRSDRQLQSISPKILQLRKKTPSKSSGSSNDLFQKRLTDDINDEWDVLNNNRFQTLSAYELDLMDPKQIADDVVFL